MFAEDSNLGYCRGGTGVRFDSRSRTHFVVGEYGIWSGVWGRNLCGFRGSQVEERLGLDLGFRLDLVFAC